MKKNNLQIKNNLKIGLKVSLVGIVPSIISGIILTIFRFEYDPMTFFNGVVLGFAILLNFYLYGYFINKWNKWIFN